MNSVRDYILTNSTDLHTGQTTRDIPCPKCGMKEFTVTLLDLGVIYRCYRDKCDLRASFIPLSGAELLSKSRLLQSDTFKPKCYTNPLHPIPHPLRLLLQEWYGITIQNQIDQGFKYDRSTKKVYLPIFDYFGREIGCVSRVLDVCTLNSGVGKYHKKAKTYLFNNVPSIHFPILTEAVRELNTCYIVEDIYSAVRLSKYVPACALAGTGLNDERVGEIRKYYSNVVLALDDDTWHKLIPECTKLKDKFGVYFDTFTTQYIPKDFKDMTDSELRSYTLPYAP